MDEPAASNVNDAFDDLLAMADPAMVVGQSSGKGELDAMFDRKASASSEELEAEPTGPRIQISKADMLAKFSFQDEMNMNVF